MERFGWIIRRVFSEGRPQYLSSVCMPAEGKTVFGFANSRHNAELLDTAMMDAVMRKLHEKHPGWKFEPVELFWSESK
jgi:hypothetical protein